MKAIDNIAKILRVEPALLKALDKSMSEKTGKKKVIDEIYETNQRILEIALKKLKVKTKSSEEIFFSLINRLRRADKTLSDYFGRPNFIKPESFKPMIKKALKLTGEKKGFYLKEEVAENLLRKNPPPNLLKAGEYRNVNDLIKKEDIYEIYANLRLLEDNKWMNDVFLNEYKNLKADDFEERKVKFIILDRRWLEIAMKFIEKKYHNLSHLKELGVVFILPMTDHANGENFRLFSLSLHYLNELSFYSKLIKRYSESDNFGEKLISLLQGNVAESRKGLKDDDWMIVQRYLAKTDKQDPRLLAPHINPEVIHWKKAERILAQFGKEFPEIEMGFWEDLFWQDFDWIGDFYHSEKEGEILVSFDLVDNIMSLVQEKELIKYLYHQQEALWNRIFEGYVGGDKELEEMTLDNIYKGYIRVTKNLK
ncbi:hypothetical protein D4R86_03550 [bacterium]|nr:MAG: hypothetical protein D4R86_03550 [bacterium]